MTNRPIIKAQPIAGWLEGLLRITVLGSTEEGAILKIDLVNNKYKPIIDIEGDFLIKPGGTLIIEAIRAFHL